MTPNENFRNFRKQLLKGGYFERKPGRIIGELGIFVAATVVGVGLLIWSDSLLIDILAMLLITLAGMGVSTNAHTASHNSVSKQRWVNELLAYFGYPFFLQLSLSYWRHKHLVVHHYHPNVAGQDDDADLAPYFALSAKDVERAGPLLRTLYRVQWLYFPILLVGNAFNVVLTGWMFLLGKLADRNERRAEHWIDLSVLLLHYAGWVLLPALFLPLQDVVMFAIARFALMSYGMFALFAPAHFPAEALMLEPGTADDDWVAAQTVTAVNFRTGWLGRLICGGVEFQIEHHLFPTISPARYPELSAKVQAFCEEHGYPYRTLGWGEGIWKSFTVLTSPKRLYNNVEDARSASRTEDLERELVLDFDHTVTGFSR